MEVSTQMNELYHHGIKGQKWGVRRFQNKDGSLTSAGERRRNSLDSQSTDTQKKQLSDKQKKAIKVGLAVAGTALAAYGTYKAAQYIKASRESRASAMAENYIKNNAYRIIGKSTFEDGSVQLDYVKRGNWNDVFTERGSRSSVGKGVGAHNARIVAESRKMYSDATNTKFDKALTKIVRTGDSVKRSVNSTRNTISKSANNAKNRFLDVVNPIYENRRVGTITTNEVPQWFKDAVGPNAKVSGTTTKDIYQRVKVRRK